MTQEQLNYAKAKAMFLTLKERKQKLEAERIPKYLEPMTHEQIEDWASKTTEIETELGYWEAFDLLIKAEKQLIQSTRNLLSKDKRFTPELERVFTDSIPGTDIHKKLIDLCFKLKTETIKV